MSWVLLSTRSWPVIRLDRFISKQINNLSKGNSVVSYNSEFERLLVIVWQINNKTCALTAGLVLASELYDNTFSDLKISVLPEVKAYTSAGLWEEKNIYKWVDKTQSSDVCNDTMYMHVSLFCVVVVMRRIGGLTAQRFHLFILWSSSGEEPLLFVS